MNKGAKLTVTVSVIVPVLNEAEGVVAFLDQFKPLRPLGIEIIVVDGGSVDDTPALAAPMADAVIVAAQGRSRQMNAGAALARGAILLFLHSDTRLPQAQELVAAINRLPANFGWGFFDVALSGKTWWGAVIAFLMNRRSRLTGVATGDQGIFIDASIFRSVGGFADIPLMEDIALSKTLKAKIARPWNPGLKVVTSSRRWRKRGVVKTVLLMWWLRLLYVVGVSPRRLHRLYYGQVPRDKS
ncbi:MAG: TIGR04283 family arsenosugar biosynthesis glycosyltransferase [Porticoccaceae bacterium]